MKRITMVFLDKSEAVHLSKDMCSYLYYLGKNHEWTSTYAYFGSDKLSNTEFERYCSLNYLGNENNYENMKRVAADYLMRCVRDIDVLMFTHYGGGSYSLARLAKRLNPAIKVYVKLDMGESGFRHFYDGTFLRKIKVIPEYWKSAAINLFTVENRSFYDALKNMRLFHGRIEYLPNPVSLFGVELSAIRSPEVRENIILTVGRPGIPVKNTELFVEAVRHVDRELLADWKFYIVGDPTPAFRAHVKDLCTEDPWIRERLVLYGRVSDRKELYELYAKSKIMCMTSRSESFCIAVSEAMYFGAYPILTNFGRIVNDLTNDGRYGRIVPQEDAGALADAWETAAQRQDLPALSREIQGFARAHFNYDHWTAKLDEYLMKLR